MIPPKQSSAFVAQMEEVLDIYSWPRDKACPVVCMDEQPKQLIKETRVPLPMEPGKPLRYDHEYERAGTANHFLFTAPLEKWRKVSVRERKTKIDWACEVKSLLDDDFPEVDLVILICDQLNTHCISSLYEAFDPAEAKRLADRLDLRHTPKHGSWLNIAEIELSVLTRQCLNRRIPDIQTLRNEAKAWAQSRNKKQKSVNWQFKTEDARIKLKRLYPQINES